MDLSDFFASALVCLFGIVGVVAFTRRRDAFFSRVVVLGFIGHVASAVAQILITSYVYYGQGDMLTYFGAAEVASSALETNFSTAAPELVKYLFQQPSIFSDLFGGAESSGSFIAITALFQLVFGRHLYAVTIAISLCSFAGGVMMLEGSRQLLPERYHRAAALATLLVPSVVFWSSGLLKESLAIAGVGMLVYALAAFEARRFVRLILTTAVAVTVIALIKPYVLFAFVIGLTGWIVARRAKAKGGLVVRPSYLLGAAVLGVAAIVVLGQVFPAFSADHLAENVDRAQELGAQVGGGSYYGPSAGTTSVDGAVTRSPIAQVAYVPIALLSALFRPLLIEARNAQMLIAALESTAFLVIFFRSLSRGRRDVWRDLFGEPMLVFSLAFSLTLATGVGLATTNFGTLVRYRAPMLPSWVLIILVLSRAAEPVQTMRPVRRPRPDDRVARSNG